MQFEAEFRRYSLKKNDIIKFDDFYKLIEMFHKLSGLPFSVYYVDPIQGDLLPINNDDNLAKAITCSKSLLRLIIQRKGNLNAPIMMFFASLCYQFNFKIFLIFFLSKQINILKMNFLAEGKNTTFSTTLFHHHL